MGGTDSVPTTTQTATDGLHENQNGGYFSQLPPELNYNIKRNLSARDVSQLASTSRVARGYARLTPQNWANGTLKDMIDYLERHQDDQEFKMDTFERALVEAVVELPTDDASLRYEYRNYLIDNRDELFQHAYGKGIIELGDEYQDQSLLWHAYNDYISDRLEEDIERMSAEELKNHQVNFWDASQHVIPTLYSSLVDKFGDDYTQADGILHHHALRGDCITPW